MIIGVRMPTILSVPTQKMILSIKLRDSLLKNTSKFSFSPWVLHYMDSLSWRMQIRGDLSFYFPKSYAIVIADFQHPQNWLI